MTDLVVAAAAFLATHFVTSTRLRPRLVGAMGEWPYRGLYSLVALVTLGWMIWAYAAAPRELLWTGIRHIPYWAMPVAFVLIACGYWRNPTMVGADRLLQSTDPARGIIRITRHPIMWGIMLWAAAHILARGDMKSLVFFGAFLVLAVVGTTPTPRSGTIALALARDPQDRSVSRAPDRGKTPDLERGAADGASAQQLSLGSNG